MSLRPIVTDNKVQLFDDIVYIYYVITCHRTFWSIYATINLSSLVLKPFHMIIIAMGVDVDSLNMSDRVEFDAHQTSDLAETMAKRLLVGFH